MSIFVSYPLRDRPPRPPVESQPTYLTSPDGSRLYYRLHGQDDDCTWIWLVDGGGGAVRAHIDPVIASLTELGYRVAEFHPRGSGYSDGPRGDVEDFERILADQDQFLRWLRDRVADRPLILLGSSAGGAMSAELLARNPRQVQGVILINPAYRYQRAVGPSFGQIVRFGFNWLFRRKALSVDMMDGIDRLTGDDLQEARERAEDPMVIRYFSLRYLGGLRRCLRRLPHNAARADAPVLLAYGENDEIIDHTGSQEIHRAWAHTDKTIVSLPGQGHGRLALHAAIPHLDDWLNARFPTHQESSSRSQPATSP